MPESVKINPFFPYGTQTIEDAKNRIVYAEIGSLANNPSNLYMVHLRKYIYAWLGRIDEHFYETYRRENARIKGKEA